MELIFLCSVFQNRTIGHWSQYIELPLPAFIIVSMYKLAYGFLELVIGMKLAQVVHFALEDSPEAFHGTIVDASTNTGHTLNHTGFIKFMSELSVGILETAVAVKQGFCIGILFDGKVKRIENQLVVIACTYSKGNDAIVFKVKDCAEVEFLAITVLEFSYIGQPLLIELFSCKVPVEYIFRCHFGCGTSILRSFSSDDRFQINQTG